MDFSLCSSKQTYTYPRKATKGESGFKSNFFIDIPAFGEFYDTETRNVVELPERSDIDLLFSSLSNNNREALAAPFCRIYALPTRLLPSVGARVSGERYLYIVHPSPVETPRGV